jgi:hypothetical protein
VLAYYDDGRYRLKSAYQRNKLAGTAASCVVALVIITLCLWPAGHEQLPSAPLSFVSETGGQNAVTGRARYIIGREPGPGFLGFINQDEIQTVMTVPAIAVALPETPVTEPDGLPIIADYSDGLGLGPDTGEGIGSGSGDGLDDNFGLPQNDFTHPPTRFLTAPYMPPFIPDPGLIALSPPRFPREADSSDTGIVVLEVTIGKDRRLTWKILEETPPKSGFGREVVQALLRSRIYPKRVNGHPVDVTVTYVCVLCATCDFKLTSTSPDFVVTSSR